MVIHTIHHQTPTPPQTTTTGYRQVGAWHLPNVTAPHDIAAAAAIPELTGARERMLALFVAETRASNDAEGSQLRKLIVVPDGVDLQALEQQAAGVLAARQQIEDVLAATAVEVVPGGIQSRDDDDATMHDADDDAAKSSDPSMAPVPAPALPPGPAVPPGPVSSNLTGIISGFGGGVPPGTVVAVGMCCFQVGDGACCVFFAFACSFFCTQLLSSHGMELIFYACVHIAQWWQ